MVTIINDTPLTDSPPVISVVIPAYNEEENIGEMSGILAKVLDSTGLKWEVLFVDDGSSDNTWKSIHELRRTYPSIRGIKFSRNFGHQYALYAGLSLHREMQLYVWMQICSIPRKSFLSLFMSGKKVTK
jgi:glycosyltransferase involved in cell wall biosynthesis